VAEVKEKVKKHLAALFEMNLIESEWKKTLTLLRSLEWK
jgi:hypothetical protein